MADSGSIRCRNCGQFHSSRQSIEFDYLVETLVDCPIRNQSTVHALLSALGGNKACKRIGPLTNFPQQKTQAILQAVATANKQS